MTRRTDRLYSIRDGDRFRKESLRLPPDPPKWMQAEGLTVWPVEIRYVKIWFGDRNGHFGYLDRLDLSVRIEFDYLEVAADERLIDYPKTLKFSGIKYLNRKSRYCEIVAVGKFIHWLGWHKSYAPLAIHKENGRKEATHYGAQDRVWVPGLGWREFGDNLYRHHRARRDQRNTVSMKDIDHLESMFRREIEALESNRKALSEHGS